MGLIPPRNKTMKYSQNNIVQVIDPGFTYDRLTDVAAAYRLLRWQTNVLPRKHEKCIIRFQLHTPGIIETLYIIKSLQSGKEYIVDRNAIQPVTYLPDELFEI